MGSGFVARRLVQASLTILFIVVLNFILFRMMPGSPERVLTRNPNISAEVKQNLREKWGLDKPLIPDQFLAFVASTAQGDLGLSYKYRGQPVTEVLGAAGYDDVRPIHPIAAARSHNVDRREYRRCVEPH